jgi:hypothetical protein
MEVWNAVGPRPVIFCGLFNEAVSIATVEQQDDR